MSSPKTQIWWRHGTDKRALKTAINSLADQFQDTVIQLAYIEPRPGSGLVHPDIKPLPTLIDGSPGYDFEIDIDELRLFADRAGLHAIDDNAQTRWMWWRLDQPMDSKDWKQIEAEVLNPYPVLPLDREGASRFGVDPSGLPPDGNYQVHEYRLNGELFCWNLSRKSS